MKKISNGYTKDEFIELYRDDRYILVKSTKEDLKYGYGPYSFGLIKDFYCLYFFPVNQSCLHKNGIIDCLNRFIEIDKKYEKELPYKNDNIRVWKKMIEILESEEI